MKKLEKKICGFRLTDTQREKLRIVAFKLRITKTRIVETALDDIFQKLEANGTL